MSKQPPLGSLAVHTPQTEKFNVSPSTCFDLSLFKELLRQYRRIDDSISMRLNRAGAAVRDQDRERSTDNGGKSIQEAACLNLWQDLMNNWSQRSKLIVYCLDVMQKSFEGTKSDTNDRQLHFEAETKRNQLQNEVTIEAIIRKRSLEVFRSRCHFFEPPPIPPEVSNFDSSTRK